MHARGAAARLWEETEIPEDRNGATTWACEGVAAAVMWLAAAVRKAVAGSVPGLVTISALVLTLQAAVVLATGSVLLFLLQFPLSNLALCVLFGRTAPTRKPLVAQLAGEVVALRYPSRHSVRFSTDV